MKTTLCYFTLLFSITYGAAQGYLETQKIISSAIQPAENYGFDVALDGDYAVIGAKGKAVNFTNQGGAYVLKKQPDGSWTEHQILLAPDSRQFDSFGQSVTIFGDVIVVGAIGQDYDVNNQNFASAAGAVYIYKKDNNDNWNFIQKIVANDRISDGYFGFAVDIYDDTIVVGATRDDFDENGENFLNRAGSAYVFEEDTNGVWLQIAKINASERATEDRFGNAVTIYEDWIAVGARLEDEDENDQNTISGSGSAFLFKRDTNGNWNYSQKIVPQNRNAIFSYGWSLDLYQESLVVGAIFGAVSGAVFVLDKDSNDVWNEAQVLTVSDGQSGDRFGSDVVISDNKILGSSILDSFVNSGMANQHGSVYLFLRDAISGQWNQQQKILASDWQDPEPQEFGYTIAMSGDDVIVGNPIAHEIDSETSNEIADAGSVYMLSFDEDLTLSITETVPQPKVNVYPNPVKDELNITFPEFHKTISIHIYDILGKKIFYKDYAQSSTIKLAFDFSMGMYVLNVVTNHNEVSVFKILKQ